MPDEYKPSDAAMSAAIGTSSTWDMRDADGKAQYEDRVRRLLVAAGPVIEQEALERVGGAGYSNEGTIGLVGRRMCDECEAFLGYEHKDTCSLGGQVESDQTTEKFTTVENSEEKPDPEAVSKRVEQMAMAMCAKVDGLYWDTQTHEKRDRYRKLAEAGLRMLMEVES